MRLTCTVPAAQARAKVAPCSSSAPNTNQGEGSSGRACGGGREGGAGRALQVSQKLQVSQEMHGAGLDHSCPSMIHQASAMTISQLPFTHHPPAHCSPVSSCPAPPSRPGTHPPGSSRGAARSSPWPRVGRAPRPAAPGCARTRRTPAPRRRSWRRGTGPSACRWRLRGEKGSWSRQAHIELLGGEGPGAGRQANCE